MVTVVAVDLNKKRISLSLKDPSKPAPAPKAKDAPRAREAPKAKTAARPHSAPKPQPPQKPGTHLDIRWKEIW
jgi:transcriptional accessory protein Tex/SPT6